MLANLTVFAGSPQLATGDLQAFHERAVAALQPLGLQLLYRDLDGQQLMNTRRPWGTPLPRSEQPEIDAAVRATLKPHVSDVIMGTVAGRPIVTLTAPVQYGGELRGFLHMSIDPERLLAIMKGQKLPPEWNTILVDRKGVVIARLQRHDEFVGKPLPARLQAPLDGQIGRSDQSRERRDAAGRQAVRHRGLADRRRRAGVGRARAVRRQPVVDGRCRPLSSPADTGAGGGGGASDRAAPSGRSPASPPWSRTNAFRRRCARRCARPTRLPPRCGLPRSG